MSPERWHRVCAIFAAALRCSPAERGALLAAACADDPQLRAEVERLLADDDTASRDGSRDLPTVADIPFRPIAEGPGTRIGPYKLLQPIGEGGMGTVYMAEQTSRCRRRVALKLIKAGMDSRQVLARFEAERQALALMDHPNIAKVLDAGTTDSRPALLRHGAGQGHPDHPVLRRATSSTPRERLELFIPVCQAVQHAHQKGIIHRDLKPSNVLIALYDGKPVPKVIDFGVAKATGPRLTEQTLFTAVRGGRRHAGVHEPRAGRAEPARHRHPQRHLLAGRAALRAADRHARRWTASGCKRRRSCEMLRMIREEEPPRPSTRLSDSGEALPSIAAQRQHRAGAS